MDLDQTEKEQVNCLYTIRINLKLYLTVLMERRQ